MTTTDKSSVLFICDTSRKQAAQLISCEPRTARFAQSMRRVSIGFARDGMGDTSFNID
jgi:hypothetical protein